jgi:peptidoglycan/LPS O-acetylase OafA/YrhL
MPIINNFRYRPEIDGLRAVAVLAVLFFHADLGFPGGFVGVDIFFVISGFLITSLIWKDLETDRFSFANFWERRARRIMPALIGVTLAVLAAASFILLPLDFNKLGQAVTAQTAFVANFFYWKDSGYFSAAAQEKPLLHIWSLAVEEQFYFVIPFLLWGLFQFKRLRQRAVVLALLSLFFALSFAFSVFCVKRLPSMAFYLLPSRAWEMLLGSLVAFLPLSPSILRHRVVAEGVALSGLALILYAVFKYDAQTPFPGLAALPPCLGAALLIWANGTMEKEAPTATGQLLSKPPLVFIGVISYSLYLWHWPLLAFARSVALFPLGAPLRAGLLTLSFVLAVLSWRFIETPFRKRIWGASRRSMFAATAAGLAVVACCGILINRSGGFPNRFSSQIQTYAKAPKDIAFRNQVKTAEVKSGKLVPIGVDDPAKKLVLMVWGDSHAMSAMSAVDAFLRGKGLRGVGATHASNAPVLDWMRFASPDADAQPIPFNNAVFEIMRAQKIPNVLLVGYWQPCVQVKANSGTEERAKAAAFGPALLETIKRFKAIGIQPWLMLDVPIHSFNPPKALAHSIYSKEYIDSISARPQPKDELESLDPQLLTKIKAAGGRILDPKPHFLDASGDHYIIERDGYSLYWDQSHLTTHGAKLLIPFFNSQLKIREKE